MDNQDKVDFHADTLAIRSGHRRSHEGEHGEPIFTTSSFVFESAAQAAARFSEVEPGNVYSRFTNPTVRTFQDRLAALEGGECCIATASGMSAILATCMSQLKTGDHVVASKGMFGSTTMLFNNYLARFGVSVSFAAPSNTQEWSECVQDNTKLFFLETPTNPLTELADIRAISSIAKAHQCLLVVDNCFCTPALQKPLALGADIVIHSATKFLDGQGRCVGGAVVGSEEVVGKDVLGFLRTCGPTMSPFNAWVFIKGLETLSLRMRGHCENAQVLAEWLDEHPAIEHVYYPGLSSHPQHELAKSQQAGFGGVVSFEVKGGQEAAWHVIDSTAFLSITANLGDVKTTITHPATTTHGRLTDALRDQAGIRSNLIRVAVGLEHIEDIKADLQRGLSTLPTGTTE